MIVCGLIGLFSTTYAELQSIELGILDEENVILYMLDLMTIVVPPALPGLMAITVACTYGRYSN